MPDREHAHSPAILLASPGIRLSTVQRNFPWGEMIEQVVAGVLTSFGGALAERFANGRGESVEVQPIAHDVRELMATQERTEVAVKELTALFRDVIEHIDGLVWSQGKLRTRTSVRFEPTEAAPTLGDALINLDRYIRQLQARGEPTPPGDP